MKVIVLRDIAAGEEVLTSYIDLALPVAERQSELKERYGFECKCEECISRTGVDPREAVVCEGCQALLSTKGPSSFRASC